MRNSILTSECIEQGSVRWSTADTLGGYEQRTFRYLAEVRRFAEELTRDPNVARISVARRYISRWEPVERIR